MLARARFIFDMFIELHFAHVYTLKMNPLSRA